MLQLGVVAHAFSSSTWDSLCESEASMVYRENFRIELHRDPVSKNKQEKEQIKPELCFVA